MPTPGPLERLVEGLRVLDVVPHPLYPELSSLGSKLVAMPICGRVGSLLGLNPYSSTSFLRSSSASFLALRFLHQKIRAKMINATETTGTTTATAIVPPAESPLES